MLMLLFLCSRIPLSFTFKLEWHSKITILILRVSLKLIDGVSLRSAITRKTTFEIQLKLTRTWSYSWIFMIWALFTYAILVYIFFYHWLCRFNLILGDITHVENQLMWDFVWYKGSIYSGLMPSSKIMRRKLGGMPTIFVNKLLIFINLQWYFVWWDYGVVI